MRRRWRILLPIIALCWFGLGTFGAVKRNREWKFKHVFYWSFIRLDRRPGLPKEPVVPQPCPDKTNDCIEMPWQPETVWVEPGPVGMAGFYTGLPVFVVEAGILALAARLNVDQVPVFFVSAPLLLIGWFYFVGWLIDRWRQKRMARQTAA